jgi:hypothetical protein
MRQVEVEFALRRTAVDRTPLLLVRGRADDATVPVLDAAGLAPDGLSEMLLGAMPASVRPACEATTSRRTPPYSADLDEHHAVCWRADHVRRVATACRDRGGRTSGRQPIHISCRSGARRRSRRATGSARVLIGAVTADLVIWNHCANRLPMFAATARIVAISTGSAALPLSRPLTALARPCTMPHGDETPYTMTDCTAALTALLVCSARLPGCGGLSHGRRRR